MMKPAFSIALGALLALAIVPTSAVAQTKRPAALASGDAAPTPWKRYTTAGRRATPAAFNTLANPHASPAAPKEPRKLDGPLAGDAENGAKLVADRTRGGSCLACHIMGQAGNADLPGNVGPDLSEIGNAGREDEWLWNYVNDARVYNPATIMPPWGTHQLFNATEIGDIVAFLKTLKSPATFKTEVDNPAKRHAPVENRDNLDSTTNPAMWAVDKGEELYKKREASGFACATCHGDAATRFKTWAGRHAEMGAALDKVLGIEEFVFRHTKATTAAAWLMQSDENLAMAVYLRNLANGQEMQVDVASPGAKEAFERGRALTEVKVGTLNFSCRDCHDPQRRWPQMDPRPVARRAEGPARPFPDLAHQASTRSGTFAGASSGATSRSWANELPPDAKEYGDLELYLASVNNGLKLSVPGIRH